MGGTDKINKYQADTVKSTVPQIFARPRAYLRRRPKIRAKSAAAFMLLPQFRLCFQGFKHIYPSFMWLMAMVLIQANLIPQDHPALRYGQPGVAKAGFQKLMGEAWFNLKTRRSTAYQWSLFGALVMMVVFSATAVGCFIARVCFGLGEVAQAQIFLFSTPNDPYSKGVGVTDINSTIGTFAKGDNPLFDVRVQGTDVSSDYALMVLDKILRQAAANTPNGGAFQNALAGLMEVYNTGMLVVACIMIGWLIMSVLIDTAKTGTIGGGRHNMVWTPVRIIFALGIMFPLGNAGFSAGQYGIMKLAEYGSNFAARGWAAYVTGVIANEQLLTPFAANNATSLVTGISKIMVCQVAYNAYIQQSTGALDPNYAIGPVKEDFGSLGYVTTRYTNKTAANLCGAIQYDVKKADDNEAFLKQTPGTAVTHMTASTTPDKTDNVYVNVPLQTAAAAFRDAMRGAISSALDDSGGVITTARQFACQFVARRFSDGGNASDNPVGQIPQCPGVSAAASDPDANAQKTMLNQLMQALQSAYEGDGKKALTNYIGTGASGPMVTEMSKHGWAGMGMWYQDITTLNGLIHGGQHVPATYTPGSFWMGSDSAELRNCAGGYSQVGETCKLSTLEEKVTAILGDYDRWWEVASTPGAPGTQIGASTASNQDTNATSSDVGAFMNSLGHLVVGDNGLLNVMGRLVFPRSSDTMIFKAIDLSATNTYPLAQLADVGHSILFVGAMAWSSVTLLQAVSTIKGWTFSLGQGFAVSALCNGIATIGTSMIMAGIMISFYLPILPFLRVAFAVLTWMTSVFEAVVMVPVAALLHLSTTGSGLMGGARTAWILWLNVLLRPILVVFGFIGGMLLYNSFALFFHVTFMQAASVLINAQWWWTALLCKVAYSVIYLGTLYAAANTSFKLLDVLPNALMRWLEGASPDKSLDSHDDGARLYAGVTVLQNIQGSVAKFTPKMVDPNAMQDTDSSPNVRAARMMEDAKKLTPMQQQRAEEDKQRAYGSLSKQDKARYNNMSSRDQQRFLAHKFFESEDRKHKRFSWDRGHGFSLTGREQSAGKTILGTTFRGFEGGNVQGLGKRGFADRTQFRELDRSMNDPNLAVGNIAGAAVGDKLLDNLLAASQANRTHTSHFDQMSPAQREQVRHLIEDAMSAPDARRYASLDDDDKWALIEDYYASAPEEFAPGVEASVLNSMTNDLYQAENRAALSRLQGFIDVDSIATQLPRPRDAAAMERDWAFMTREQKAQSTEEVMRRQHQDETAFRNAVAGGDALDKYNNLDTTGRRAFKDLVMFQNSVETAMRNGGDAGLGDIAKTVETLRREKFGF